MVKRGSQLISVFVGFLVILLFIYILQKSGVIREGFQDNRPKTVCNKKTGECFVACNNDSKCLPNEICQMMGFTKGTKACQPFTCTAGQKALLHRCRGPTECLKASDCKTGDTCEFTNGTTELGFCSSSIKCRTNAECGKNMAGEDIKCMKGTCDSSCRSPRGRPDMRLCKGDQMCNPTRMVCQNIPKR